MIQLGNTDVPVDSLADSEEAVIPEPVYGIMIEPPAPYVEPPLREDNDRGVSFVTMSLFIMFFVIAFRFHNNRKFLGALFRSLIEVKERGNMFDDTVRETSFLLFLNILWCACSGVILFRLIEFTGSPDPSYSFPPLSFSSGAGMGICIGIAAIYTLFMTFCYITVGNVFSDSIHARIWFKGFAASQGILGFFYFPLALAFIAYPDLTLPLLWVAAIGFIMAKAVFIWKGLRIFFTQISSWVLFLYYLCSLEIVPLILTYFMAVYLCRT